MRLSLLPPLACAWLPGDGGRVPCVTGTGLLCSGATRYRLYFYTFDLAGAGRGGQAPFCGGGAAAPPTVTLHRPSASSFPGSGARRGPSRHDIGWEGRPSLPAETHRLHASRHHAFFQLVWSRCAGVKDPSMFSGGRPRPACRKVPWRRAAAWPWWRDPGTGESRTGGKWSQPPAGGSGGDAAVGDAASRLLPARPQHDTKGEPRSKNPSGGHPWLTTPRRGCSSSLRGRPASKGLSCRNCARASARWKRKYGRGVTESKQMGEPSRTHWLGRSWKSPGDAGAPS